MRRCNTVFILFVILLFSSFVPSLFSYQWPVEPRILSVFGQWKGESFFKGITLFSPASEVKPIEDGEIIFSHYESIQDGRLPYALGSFIVIEHENALRSIYGNFALSESAVDSKTYVGKTDSLGKAGLTGAAETSGVSLFIYDGEAGQFVNPFLLLPPFKDSRRPVIRNVQLESKDALITLPTSDLVPKGNWEITAEIYDLSSAVTMFWPMGVYKVSLYINGQELFTLTMDALKESAGKIRVYPSEGFSAEQVYKEAFRMRLKSVQLNPGVANIEIVARDFTGNERNQTFRFRVGD
ncbi:MAG TPA: peptidoglycan DD-metalloendopeptidase family protein [Spirochaetales bacterium]|nr:M23 family metallopeptidase [Spirochaetales bacterium]HOV39843.1 peptidoglycan DD-metalloendopeptidase family protein [Spirochaetales bacterium]